VDVIHSFWEPQLAGTIDAVPCERDGGFSQNALWFTADRPGRFAGQCAEFCGAQHAGMRFDVVAMPEAEYEAWLAAQAAPAAPPVAGSDRARGLELVATKGCQGCHAIDGVEGMAGTVGPNLTHVGSRARLAGGMFENTPEVMHDWVDNPPALKPGTTMPDLNLTADELAAVVAYLQGLE
jgi:cytochrome c oxidase subunit 2